MLMKMEHSIIQMRITGTASERNVRAMTRNTKAIEIRSVTLKSWFAMVTRSLVSAPSPVICDVGSYFFVICVILATWSFSLSVAVLYSELTRMICRPSFLKISRTSLGTKSSGMDRADDVAVGNDGFYAV